MLQAMSRRLPDNAYLPESTNGSLRIWNRYAACPYTEPEHLLRFEGVFQLTMILLVIVAHGMVQTHAQATGTLTITAASILYGMGHWAEHDGWSRNFAR